LAKRLATDDAAAVADDDDDDDDLSCSSVKGMVSFSIFETFLYLG
jgi:hypothetical protein